MLLNRVDITIDGERTAFLNTHLKAGASVLQSYCFAVGRFSACWPSPRPFLKFSPTYFFPFSRGARILSCRALDPSDERFDTFSDKGDCKATALQ